MFALKGRNLQGNSGNNVHRGKLKDTSHNHHLHASAHVYVMCHCICVRIYCILYLVSVAASALCPLRTLLLRRWGPRECTGHSLDARLKTYKTASRCCQFWCSHDFCYVSCWCCCCCCLLLLLLFALITRLSVQKFFRLLANDDAVASRCANDIIWTQVSDG